MARAPKIRATAEVAGQSITLRDRGALRMLELLIAAGGDWVDPISAGIGGATLTRNATLLRSRYSLPVESETVRTERGFHNRHRLARAATLKVEGGANV
jgi:hypothetical protein